jgi:uncharacterized membrane protein YbhN (UPF0104 family)
VTTRHPRLRRAARIGFYVFLAAVAVLLARAARAVDWAQVTAAIAGYGGGTLALALLLTATSYLVYCGYDLAARRYAHHALPTRRVALIALTCYAFSLNLGALVGGAGFRLRLYSQSGLSLPAITRIIGFSVTTNWLGYILLAGLLFASGLLQPPPELKIGATALRAAGLAMLAVVPVYLVACHVAHGRVFHLGRHHFRLPSPRLAAVQLALASVNWALMGAIVWTLLPSLPYPLVVATLLLGAVATAIAHIPAGIGVLEAVFLAVLGGMLPQAEVLAALLVYRAWYYLLPLMVALALYALFEWRQRRGAERRLEA